MKLESFWPLHSFLLQQKVSVEGNKLPDQRSHFSFSLLKFNPRVKVKSVEAGRGEGGAPLLPPGVEGWLGLQRDRTTSWQNSAARVT